MECEQVGTVVFVPNDSAESTNGRFHICGPYQPVGAVHSETRGANNSAGVSQPTQRQIGGIENQELGIPDRWRADRLDQCPRLAEVRTVLKFSIGEFPFLNEAVDRGFIWPQSDDPSDEPETPLRCGSSGGFFRDKRGAVLIVALP